MHKKCAEISIKKVLKSQIGHKYTCIYCPEELFLVFGLSITEEDREYCKYNLVCKHMCGMQCIHRGYSSKLDSSYIIFAIHVYVYTDLGNLDNSCSFYFQLHV